MNNINSQNQINQDESRFQTCKSFRPSVPPEETYYTEIIIVTEKSIKEYPRFFRSIASEILASIDDTILGRLVTWKIVSMNKLAFTIYRKLQNLIAYMIPDALMEMTDTSLSGKTITLLSFSGEGKEAEPEMWR